MDTTLKQRILGIIVLFALIGICLSVLLHRNENNINKRRPLPSTSSMTLPAPKVVTPAPTPAAPTVFNNPIVSPTPTSNNSGQPARATTNPVNNTAVTAQPAQIAQENIFSSENVGVASAANTVKPLPSQNIFKAAQPSTATTSTVTPVQPSTKSTSTTRPTTRPLSASRPTAVRPDYTAGQITSNTNRTGSVPTGISGKAYKVASVPSQAVLPFQSAHAANKSLPAAHHHRKAVGINQGAVVQVGSFSLPANAEKLATQLRAKGFAASTQKIKTSEGTMVRVIVGKAGLDKAQAETLRTSLIKEMHLTGFLTSHNPAQSASAIAVRHASVKATPVKTKAATAPKETAKGKTLLQQAIILPTING